MGLESNVLKGDDEGVTCTDWGFSEMRKWLKMGEVSASN